jgi:hypothetical protein
MIVEKRATNIRAVLYKFDTFAPDLLTKMPENAWIKFLFIHKKPSPVTLSISALVL